MKSTNKTWDYLPNTDIHLYQRKDMFRMNTDTALLGNFMKVKKGESVVDMGCNNGALLLYASRFEPSKMIGIDVFEEACELACENMILNDLSNVEILVSDIKDVVINKVDVVVCNPPYFDTSNSQNRNESRYLEVARHEKYMTLHQCCFSASRFLKEKGRFYLVHRASRITEVLIELSKCSLEVKTMQFVYDENKKEAITVLIEAVKNGKPNTRILPPLTLKR